MRKVKKITFASGFSGIGGFDKGLEQAGGFKRVWSNDINKYANQVYTSHFGEENHYSGDIRAIDPKDIPSHDIFCGGFPCQSFSVAGKRKGFTDTRGTLFFEICRIAAYHRPKLLFLENVKGLLSAPLIDETGNTIPGTHGRVFEKILKSLEELGYWWEYQVLNSKNYGVPQNRQRVFIIGHIRTGSTRPIFPITKSNGLLNTEYVGREGIASTLDANYFKGARRQRQFVMEPYIKNLPHGYNDGFEKPLPSLKANSGAQYNELLVLPKLEALGNVYPENNPDAGRVYNSKGLARTLKGEAGGMGGKTGLYQIENAKIRRLTPIECERLQGFPDGWTEGISDTQRYKCLGNAVTVNVIEFLGHKLRASINSKRLG